MSQFNLNLPTDIPWERICVSEDMIDKLVCDHSFPAKWKSSLALFHYQPPADFQVYDDMTVSYIKVSASITGYQPDGDEIGIKYPDWGPSTFDEAEMVENFK